MTNIKLSPRMQTIADMAEGKTAADIGCDHAFVSIYLVKEKGFDRVIAMDVKKGPLEIAEKNIKLYGAEDKISIRLSDGFENLEPKEADTAIMAGMGGALMTDILKKGRVHSDYGINLILQPQSEPEKVRKYIEEIEYVIIDEAIIIDEGKYYTVIKAVSRDKYSMSYMSKDRFVDNSLYNGEYPKAYSDAELLYGRLLIERKDKILKQYLEEQFEKNNRIMDFLKTAGTDNAMQKLSELKRDNEVIGKVLEKL